MFDQAPAPKSVKVNLVPFEGARLVEYQRALDLKAERDAVAAAEVEHHRAIAEAQETARLARIHGEATDLIERGLDLAKRIKETDFSHSREAFDAASNLLQIVRAAQRQVETNGLNIDLSELRRVAGPILSAQSLRLP